MDEEIYNKMVAVLKTELAMLCDSPMKCADPECLWVGEYIDCTGGKKCPECGNACEVWQCNPEIEGAYRKALKQAKEE